ncbi:MAG: hypothetical protein ABI907_03085, partial [Ramlibacter sp.]
MQSAERAATVETLAQVCRVPTTRIPFFLNGGLGKLTRAIMAFDDAMLVEMPAVTESIYRCCPQLPPGAATIRTAAEVAAAPAQRQERFAALRLLMRGVDDVAEQFVRAEWKRHAGEEVPGALDPHVLYRMGTVDGESVEPAGTGEELHAHGLQSLRADQPETLPTLRMHHLQLLFLRHRRRAYAAVLARDAGAAAVSAAAPTGAPDTPPKPAAPNAFTRQKRTWTATFAGKAAPATHMTGMSYL